MKIRMGTGFTCGELRFRNQQCESRAGCVKPETLLPLYLFMIASLFAKNRFPLFRTML